MSNEIPPLAESKTLDERLTHIGIWFAMSSIDNKTYLWCLKEAFKHWGWEEPSKRTIKTPPKPRPTSLHKIKEAVKKAPPKRLNETPTTH